MKLFTVEISVTAVVMAETEKEAHSVARFELTDIVRDCDPDVEVQGQIKALDRLPASWDPMCLPYGGDGETRLKDLLPETEPMRDTRTIDMFEGQGEAA